MKGAIQMTEALDAEGTPIEVGHTVYHSREFLIRTGGDMVFLDELGEVVNIDIHGRPNALVDVYWPRLNTTSPVHSSNLVVWG
jgi:hypothetical protein